MTPPLAEAIPVALSDAVAAVDTALVERLETADLPSGLRAAALYSAQGGKRLRPILTLLSCEAVGGERGPALAPAVAMELIHCFSLVHDDLPAMDDDDLRRGRPTLHVQAGEAMAILAGDVMLSLAFQILSEDPCLADRPADQVRMLAELSRATTSMIGGQVYDTLGGFPEGLSPSERLHLIHRNKTGALIRVSCRLGGVAGQADPDQLSALSRYGEAIGLMFQIVDDLLDVTQSSEHIGKATGKDEQAGKLTFPGLLGIDHSRQEVERLQTEAHGALAALDAPEGRTRPLGDLCDFLAVRTR